MLGLLEEETMDTLAGKTGIAIHAGMSSGSRTIGKLLSALHLEKLGAHYAKGQLMLIDVDGVERTEPFYEAHFVECAPGDHDVTVSTRNETTIGMQVRSPAVVQKAVTSKSLRVTVRAGEVVHLIYTPGVTGMTLELGGGPA
jgi:hypothetical protein